MPGGWGTPSWMGGEPSPGETYVWGKTPETARALLAAAADLGLEPMVVRTVTGGFIVPDEVYDRVEQTTSGSTSPDDEF